MSLGSEVLPLEWLEWPAITSPEVVIDGIPVLGNLCGCLGASDIKYDEAVLGQNFHRPAKLVRRNGDPMAGSLPESWTAVLLDGSRGRCRLPRCLGQGFSLAHQSKGMEAL